jgi:hypothetical protein
MFCSDCVDAVAGAAVDAMMVLAEEGVLPDEGTKLEAFGLNLVGIGSGCQMQSNGVSCQ